MALIGPEMGLGHGQVTSDTTLYIRVRQRAYNRP